MTTWWMSRSLTVGGVGFIPERLMMMMMMMTWWTYDYMVDMVDM